MSSPGLRANVPYTYQEYQYLPNDGRRYEIVEGYDQGLLFDRSATLSSPAFPEIAVLLAPLFAPL